MSMIESDTRDDRLSAADLGDHDFRGLGGVLSGDYRSAGDAADSELMAGGRDMQTISRPSLRRGETEPKVKAELAASLHFILSQYLRPSTLRRLIGPRDAMIGRVMLGRAMQGEIDDDLLARILAQAVVEHIRQSGFVVQRSVPPSDATADSDGDIWF
ncbi:MAG TPA: hypothetical protein VM639_14630 [Dongiaceae bacterium]|nr:hypothetical protein [Dongiaceae bacterium]